MSCDKFQNQIPDFLRGALNGSEEEGIVVHIATCPACRFLYQELRQKMDNEKSSGAVSSDNATG